MPGLFGNSNGGGFDDGGGVGGILGGLGATLFPGVRRYQLQQQGLQSGYDALRSNGFSDEEARASMLNPGMGQDIWNRKMFFGQFQALKQQFPDMSDAEVLSRMSSPQGTQELFTPQTFGEYHGPGGISGPGIRQGNTVTPPFSGFSVPNNNPQVAAPSSPQQPPPSAQPNSGLDNLAAQDAKFAAQKAAAVKAAETTAAAQPDLPILQTRSQQLISKLEAIRDNPELNNVVGGPLGIKGRTRPIGQNQSDLVNDIQDANNALQGDLFTSLRATSGRGVSPGALKEMRITDLQAGRTGTIQGYKDNINKTIKQIQEEYSAAWQARGAPDPYRPNWAASATKQYPSPTAGHIEALKAQPQLRAEFDKKFGEGAAMRVLGR